MPKRTQWVQLVLPETPCAHHTSSKPADATGYAYGPERVRAGERQRQCPVCYRWFFPDEMGRPPADTTTTVIREDSQ